MKKKRFEQQFPLWELKKLLCIMKLVFFFLLLSSNLVWAGQTYAQITSLNLDLTNVKLEEVFDAIRRQSEFEFFYNNDQVNTSEKVNIKVKNAGIDAVLNQVLTDVYEYKIKDRYILINKKKEILPVVSPQPQQQSKQTITGNVTDSGGQPLPGVTVVVKGTTQGTVTNADGNFSLAIPPDAGILQFSFVGMRTQEVPIEGRTNFTVVMEEETIGMEEVVVVGYGKQKKVNMTGAVSSVDYSKESISRPLVNATQALGGIVPGLQVMQGSGNPYGESFSMNVRGLGTLNNSRPLVLVDGMEQDLGNVNPSDIESISVLKDAASSSIYGNRGANGVILVTTKTGGDKNKVNVEFSGKLSFNSPLRMPKLVNNYADYMELMNESYTNLGRPSAYSDATINLWREKEKDPNGIAESGFPNYVAYPNTDWYDAIYDTNLMQDHKLQVSGSTDNSGYNFSFGYMDNPGILKKSGFKRYFVRSNIYGDIGNWLRIGSRIWGYNTDRDRIGSGSLTSLDMTKVVPGTYPYFDGKYGAPEANEEDPQSHNPLWDMNFEHGDMKYTQIFTNFYTEMKFLKHFKYDFGFWYKHYIYDGKYASNAFPKWSFRLNEITASPIDLTIATTGQTYNRENHWKHNHVLNYEQSFGLHDVTALAGFEEVRYWGRTSNITMQGLIDTSIDDISAGTEYSNSYGDSYEYTGRSLFGRVTYAYDSRYLFEMNVRHDGSSRFAPDNRWGTFPAFSAGWRISEESFMESTKDWLYDFKLRASWGKLGNNSIGNYEWQQTYSLRNYPFNSTTNLGLAPASQANINLHWEETTTSNIGIDFGFLNNQLSGSMDYYQKLTSGILYRPSIMMIYGNLTPARKNIAEVMNNGLEVQLTWSDEINDFRYNITTNFSYNKNEVTKYKGKLVQGWETNDDGEEEYMTNLGDVSTGGTTRILEDHMMHEYYMLQPYEGDQSYFNEDGSVNPGGGPSSGMIRTEDDMHWLSAMLAEGYEFYPNQRVGKDGIWYGDYIYADHNGDGIYGNTYDNQFIGSSSMPKWNFGTQISASWKGFDVSMNWFGVAGNELYFYRNGQNSSTTIKGYAIGKEVANDHYFYDPDNPTDPRTNLSSANPRLTNNHGSSQSELTNTQWLYKGDFLKLKNLTFGYTIPENLGSIP